MPSAELWTTVGLLDHFMHVHREMHDRAFAFLLGAGASKSSGIPTGAELVQQWLGELQRQLDPDHTFPLQEWATADHLEIPGFRIERASEFYPQVFQRRFGRDTEQGYAALEHAMRDAEPGIGYSILATILAKERHRVVITPNFDNLVADALAIYAYPHPLVVGHESLARFVRPRGRRPLIAKVHGDLFLEPRNTPPQLLTLPSSWIDALQRLFAHYTPIVIGYGGNDGGLVHLLKSLEPGQIVGGLFWCYREQEGRPRQEIVDLVAQHKGALIPILGFDEVMLQLNERLEYPLLGDTIERLAQKRRETYDQSIAKLRARLSFPGAEASTEAARRQVTRALDRASQKEWETKADQESDPEKREQLYRTGIERFPRSSQLHNNGALFFEKRGKHEDAERLYRHALDLGLHQQTVKLQTNFASFLWRIRGNHMEAEAILRLASQTYPKSPRVTLHLAAFLLVNGRFAEAAEHAKASLALSGPPTNRPDSVSEALLYVGLAHRLAGADDTGELAGLKTLLRTSFTRYPRSPVDAHVKATLVQLQDPDRRLYEALFDAVLLGRRLDELDAHPRWESASG